MFLAWVPESRYLNARTGRLSVAAPRRAAVEEFDVAVLSQPATKQAFSLKKPAIVAGFFRLKTGDRENPWWPSLRRETHMPAYHCFGVRNARAVIVVHFGKCRTSGNEAEVLKSFA